MVLIYYIDDGWPCQWQVTNSVKAFLRTCNVTERIRFTITASSSFEVSAGPRRSGQSEWESNNRSSTRVKFECLESCRWYTKFHRSPSMDEKGRRFSTFLSVSSVRRDSSFVTDQEFTASPFIVKQLKS